MKKVILNLGCGKTRIPGSIGIDSIKVENYVDIVHDLDILPYPFKDMRKATLSWQRNWRVESNV